MDTQYLQHFDGTQYRSGSTLADRASIETLQRRSYALTDFEFRDDANGALSFEGVASVVGIAYPVRDMFGAYNETIRAGAFDTTLRDRKASISLYVNHRNLDVPLATRSAGTLKVSADPHLRISATLDPARPDVQIIRSAVTRGEMGEMSIGFMPVKARDKWSADRTEVERTQVSLREASIVERGCAPDTVAAFRSFDDFLDTMLDVDMSDDELHRAITYFESRLAPGDETTDAAVEAVAAAIEARDRADRERLERIRANRPPVHF